MSQTEVKPVPGACRHLRARYKAEARRKSPFPELIFVRYECEQGLDVSENESVDKCMESHIECWQKQKE